MDRDQILIDSYEGERGMFFSGPSPTLQGTIPPTIPLPESSPRCSPPSPFVPSPTYRFVSSPDPPASSGNSNSNDSCSGASLSMFDRGLLYIIIVLLVWVGALICRALGKIKKMKKKAKEFRDEFRHGQGRVAPSR